MTPETLQQAQLEWTADMIRMIADQDPRLGEFEPWLAVGVEKGWVGAPVCSTHDLVPLSPGERDAFEGGGEPCVRVVRVWSDVQSPRPLHLAAGEEEAGGDGGGGDLGPPT